MHDRNKPAGLHLYGFGLRRTCDQESTFKLRQGSMAQGWTVYWKLNEQMPNTEGYNRGTSDMTGKVRYATDGIPL
jgi:hypothetical protein